MALSKPLFFFHLKTLTLSTSFTRLLSFVTPEEPASERRRRKRRLRTNPPPPPPPQPQQQRIPSKTPINPNAPKIPEPLSALAGKRLNLHNEILNLIRVNDLDEASLLVRHSIYSNCKPTIFTCNAVLHALLRQSRYSDLLSLHRFITQASVAPTVITHNLLLDTALEHYRLLVKDDAPINPSPTTYRILTKGLVDNGKIDQAVELKDEMIDKGFCGPDAAVYNLIMSGFVKKEEPDRVIELFEEMKEKMGGGQVEDGIVYGNLMKGYFKKGMEAEAMGVYEEVLGEGSKVRFNAVSYNLVLEALTKNGKLEEAIGLFGRMMGEHYPPRKLTVNLGSFNVMVDGYCAAERFDDAIEVFRKMEEKRCTPDTLSYNNLIQQLGENKMVAEAEEFYREMGEREINPDEYTYVLLMEACFRVDRVDDAIGYFRKMVEVGLKPNANSYNKVMGGLVNVGRLDEAREFFDLMVEKEVKPNLLSYEMLAKAFVEAGRLDDALKAVKGILLDENLSFSDDMKELVEEALRKEGREEDMGKLYEEVEREKAEALARAEEEKARAEALAREEEEKKKAEAAAKEAAAARASAAAIELMSGQKKLLQSKEAKEEEAGPIASSSLRAYSDKVLENGGGEPQTLKEEEPKNETGETAEQVTSS
ncbi:uncharacterized protein A4U43_C05F19850 [Asparagus officinalis]|uniref:Pentacotripeptide-repeat region of PRORP domain-containing protein n=1 Tax=Asparagus officinalis TaxID=4686 RepID=A0A5P1ESX6_ASPOF|nr:pentatricopeptide repeat-containing protein At3g49240 [Asparagus officinalis]ONK69148.1 uncharacterized protein A4U43_C05F19850 [Asparagus officinalis]